MADSFYFKITFEHQEMTESNVSQWFKEFSLFEPKEMRGTYLTKRMTHKYKPEKFFSTIQKELNENDLFSLSIIGNELGQNISVRRGNFFSSLNGSFSEDVYETNKQRILNLLNDTFERHQGITGFARSSNENFWQNLEDIDYYKRNKKSLWRVKLKKSPIFEDDKIVDVEYNPGHSHYVKDLCLTSCWMMWFGNSFFQWVPREVFVNYTDCYKNQQLENGAIRIQLHENIWDYDTKDNRKRQWNFRRQVGIDQIVDFLDNETMGEEQAKNPTIEILNGEFEHGGIKLIHYYLNKRDEVVTKSKASSRQSYEMNHNGRVVWSEKVRL